MSPCRLVGGKTDRLTRSSLEQSRLGWSREVGLECNISDKLLNSMEYLSAVQEEP